jgi:hypothetical protein
VDSGLCNIAIAARARYCRLDRSASTFLMVITICSARSLTLLIASIAFMTRFSITCCNCTRSPKTGKTSSAHNVRIVTLFFCACSATKAAL